jgi:hypothetical protein
MQLHYAEGVGPISPRSPALRRTLGTLRVCGACRVTQQGATMMYPMIVDLVQLAQGKTKVDLLDGLDKEITPQELRLTAHAILDCLRIDDLALPVELREDWMWCQNVRRIHSRASAFRELFSIDQDVLDYRSELSAVEVDSIRQYVKDNFKSTIRM